MYHCEISLWLMAIREFIVDGTMGGRLEVGSSIHEAT
jgi:hypothetical protein